MLESDSLKAGFAQSFYMWQPHMLFGVLTRRGFWSQVSLHPAYHYHTCLQHVMSYSFGSAWSVAVFSGALGKVRLLKTIHSSAAGSATPFRVFIRVHWCSSVVQAHLRFCSLFLREGSRAEAPGRKKMEMREKEGARST